MASVVNRELAIPFARPLDPLQLDPLQLCGLNDQAKLDERFHYSNHIRRPRQACRMDHLESKFRKGSCVG